MQIQKQIKIESFVLFLPFALLAFYGVFSSTVVVYGCFALQIVSLIVTYKIENGLLINHAWKQVLLGLFFFYCLSLICSLIGYSPNDSIRVTTMIFVSLFLLCTNMAVIRNSKMAIFHGFIFWCCILGCASVIFSVYGLITGSNFQLTKVDETVIISSRVSIGPLKINQYAIQGGLINGNLGVASWFINPNLLALISLIAYIYALFYKKYFVLFLSVVGIILGFSRAILVIALFATFIYLFESSKRAVKILLVFGLIGGLFFILIAGRMTRIDLNGRQDMWKALLDYDIKNYFLPNGLGTSSQIIKDTSGLALSAHSLYINILTEYGLIGLLVFVYAIVKCFIGVKNRYNSTNYNDYINDYKVLIVVLASLLLLGFSEVTAFTFGFFNYLFFFIIFTIAGDKKT